METVECLVMSDLHGTLYMYTDKLYSLTGWTDCTNTCINLGKCGVCGNIAREESPGQHTDQGKLRSRPVGGRHVPVQCLLQMCVLVIHVSVWIVRVIYEWNIGGGGE